MFRMRALLRMQPATSRRSPLRPGVTLLTKLSVEESVAGSAAIRLDNLLLAQPQWLTSSPLPMTGCNVNLRAGGRAFCSAGHGAHRHERLCWFEAEVAISSLEVRANDQTQPNCSLPLTPSAQSRRGGTERQSER